MTTEQRAFLAVILMAAVLILYQVFFIGHEPPPAGNTSPTASQAPPKPPAPAPSSPAAPTVSVLPAPAAASESRPPQRLARVTTPLYNAAVSSEGGKLQEFTLKYRGEKPMIVIGELGPSGLVMAPSGNNSAQVVPMDLPATEVTLTREGPTHDLPLGGEAGDTDERFGGIAAKQGERLSHKMLQARGAGLSLLFRYKQAKTFAAECQGDGGRKLNPSRCRCCRPPCEFQDAGLRRSICPARSRD